MNERLKLLEQQAYITTEKEVIDGGWDNDRPPYRTHKVIERKFSLEKFAELIVKDCSAVCREHAESALDAYTPAKAKVGYDIATACADFIDKTYGIVYE